MSTVVIPHYNNPVKLLRAVKSVLNSDQSAQIIIVDDCSDDAVLKELYEFEKNNSLVNIKFIFHKKNFGPASARNSGLDMARVGPVFFLDCDDEFHPDKIDLIEAITDFDVVIHPYDTAPNTFEFSQNESNVRELSFSDFLLGNPGAGGSSICILNRDLMHLRFNKNMRYCEDYEFICKCINSGYRVGFLDLPLSLIDREPNSFGGLSARRIKMRLGELKARLSLSQAFHTKVLLLGLGICLLVIKSGLELSRR